MRGDGIVIGWDTESSNSVVRCCNTRGPSGSDRSLIIKNMLDDHADFNIDTETGRDSEGREEAQAPWDLLTSVSTQCERDLLNGDKLVNPRARTDTSPDMQKHRTELDVPHQTYLHQDSPPSNEDRT